MTDILGPASATNAVATRIAESRVFPTGDTWFKPCSTPATQDGTQIQSVFLNGLMAQLRAAIRGNGKKNDGVTPIVSEDNTNDAMLLGAILQMIQRGQANFVADTGTADAIVVTPMPALAEYEVGLRLLVLKNPSVGANATSTPKISAGLGQVTIVKNDGSAVGIGDLKKGGLFEVEFDGTNARLVSLVTLSDIVAPIQTAATSYLQVEKQRASTVAGTAFTTDVWTTWLLNTVVLNGITGANLNVSTGQITLPAGTYRAEFAGMVNNGGRHYCRLYNQTAGAELGHGLVSDSYVSGDNPPSSYTSTTTNSTGVAQFTLAAPSVVTLDHLHDDSGAALMGDDSTGFGMNYDAYVRLVKVL